MSTPCVCCGTLEPFEYVPDAFSEMCVVCGHLATTSTNTFIAYEGDPEANTGNWDPTAGSARIHAGDTRLRRGPLTSTVGGKPRILPGQTALMDKADVRGYTTATNLPDVYAHIEGLLRRLGHEGNPYTERSKQLFDQARTIGMERREELAREEAEHGTSALSRKSRWLRKETRWGSESFSMGAAAVWITLKKGGKDFALEDVAKAAAQPLSRVKIQVRHLQHLFSGTDLLSVLRTYDPAVFIPDYFAFLQTQRKPVDGRPGIASTAIGAEGLAFIAKLDAVGRTPARWQKAMQLALNLSALCIAEGQAQHKGEGGIRDVRMVAYAIVLCAIEGTLKLVGPQIQIVNSWVAAEKWRGRLVRERDREEARLEREEMGEEAEQEDEDSNDDWDDSDDEDDESSSKGHRQETVRLRYNEVMRLVLPWMNNLSWAPPEKQLSNKVITEKESIKKRKTQPEKGNTYPAQRKRFVECLADAVRLRLLLKAQHEATARAQQEDERDRAPPVVGPAAASSSRQASSDASSIDAARRDPRRARGISQLESLHTAALVLENLDGTPSFADELRLDGTTAALRGKRSINKQAKEAAEVPLSQRVPKTLFEPGVLEGLEDAAIDALLFVEGEMDRYLRSEYERKTLDRVKAQDGSWDSFTDETSKQRAAKAAAKRKRLEAEDDEGEETGGAEQEEDDVSVVGYLDED